MLKPDPERRGFQALLRGPVDLLLSQRSMFDCYIALVNVLTRNNVENVLYSEWP